MDDRVVPSVEVAAVWEALGRAGRADLDDLGLAAGLRPAADVTCLLRVAAAAECELARRMDAARRAGALPLAGAGALATAGGWSAASARRLARAGALAGEHPALAAVWARGEITGEHVDALARRVERLSRDEMAAVIAELDPFWGQLSPAGVTRFVEAAIRLLHPPPDPARDELDAYAARTLSWSILGDTVLLAGSLPRVEGEAVIAAIDAIAERLRTQADHVPGAARRADALVQLVNDAHAAGALPTRGGLPTGLTVTCDTIHGFTVATTSRGHVLTDAEARFTTCDAAVTPVLVTPVAVPPRGPRSAAHDVAGAHLPRLAALAAALLDQRIPLDVGRTQRSATQAQRRALAVRDRGCVIPGCGVPAEACQTHHLTEWATGGRSDLSNMVLLCWAHHRQVDLHMWQITARSPAAPPGPPPPQSWPGNHGSPWTVRTQPRTRWRT